MMTEPAAGATGAVRLARGALLLGMATMGFSLPAGEGLAVVAFGPVLAAGFAAFILVAVVLPLRAGARPAPSGS